MIETDIPLQVRFIKSIEHALPDHLSLVNELEELLQISMDSAYRRIRGETALTIDEVAILCQHYGLSFDAFNLSSSQNVVSFKYKPFEESADSFKLYFKTWGEDLDKITKAGTDVKRISYAGQGMPIFYYWKYRALSALKLFYWMYAVMNVKELKHEKFNIDLIDPELWDIGDSIFKNYVHVPSREIWTDNTVMGTIHQIRFFWDSGIFPNKEIALEICDDLIHLLEHVQRQAEKGKKQDDYDNPTSYGSEFIMYFSEIEFEHNCITVELGDIRRVYLGHLSFGSIATENATYYTHTENWMNRIVKRANIISGASDTMRFQFFKRSLRHIERLINKIKDD
jgi:hypothetical protein